MYCTIFVVHVIYFSEYTFGVGYLWKVNLVSKETIGKVSECAMRSNLKRSVICGNNCSSRFLVFKVQNLTKLAEKPTYVPERQRLGLQNCVRSKMRFSM